MTPHVAASSSPPKVRRSPRASERLWPGCRGPRPLPRGIGTPVRTPAPRPSLVSAHGLFHLPRLEVFRVGDALVAARRRARAQPYLDEGGVGTGRIQPG